MTQQGFPMETDGDFELSSFMDKQPTHVILYYIVDGIWHFHAYRTLASLDYVIHHLPDSGNFKELFEGEIMHVTPTTTLLIYIYFFFERIGIM